MIKYKKINLETYSRRQHFEYFLNMQYPYVGVTNMVDVTEVVAFCKEKKYSFYLVFLHLAALAADEIPAFRQRIRENGIIEYENCPTSHTEMLEDGTYCYCTLYHHMSFEQYIEEAKAARMRCREKGSIEEDEDVESMYFISALPWIAYTSLLQPVAGGEESNPRITWGKFEENCEGRKMLPVSILAHHGLVDGIQMAQFYQNIEKQIKVISTIDK